MKEETRLKKFKLRYEMFNDNYKEQVEQKLGMIYRAFRELKLDVQLHHSTNLYKSIVDKVSQAYSFGVNREFTNEVHSQLYDDLRMNKVMAQACTYLNAFNDVLVQVAYSEEKGLDLLLRLPHRTIINDDGSLEYYVENVDEKTERWAYWSETEHYYKIKGVEDKKEPVDGNEEMVNPYGFMPFIVMHNGWRDESFWDVYKGDDLTNTTIELCVHLTFLNHIIKTQSFKQLVGKGDNIKELNGQLSDPLSILTLTGQNTEIDVLDLQSNYEQLHKVIQELANNLAIRYNISPSQFRLTGNVSSGYALQMENLNLDKFVRSQQADFEYYEKELFSLINAVLDTHGKSVSGEMSINFNSPSYPESRETELNNLAKAIDLAVTSTEDYLESKGVEDAKSEVQQNIAARNELYNRVSGANLPNTATALGVTSETTN